MKDEHENQTGGVDRRSFLTSGVGALAGAAALGAGRQSSAQEAAAAVAKATESAVLPTRPLGGTGVDVTILSLGTWMSPGGGRLLRSAWARGVRYFDTAKSYGSEPMIGQWLKSMPEETRDGLFLATKDQPETPREFIAQLDQRLDALQTDYVDLFFMHALGDRNFEAELEWPRSPEFKQAADAIRKSGKANFIGFSSHHPQRAQLIQSAVQGGFIDVIMLQNNPWIAQDDEMNRALDAAAKRGIGLVSMKQVAGNMSLDDVGMALPELAMRGLTPYQSLLHAIWTDQRFSSVCVSMRNTDQIRENTAAARVYKPMKRVEIDRLHGACIEAGRTLCASCDGRCSRAAGTTAELGNLTRYLTYHDHHGHRAEARRLYAKLDDAARDWRGADLEAARQACPNRLDFAKLLPRADEVLG
jgi:aryl-alcohol dehydrogenase-like predicted oxidoreductase